MASNTISRIVKKRANAIVNLNLSMGSVSLAASLIKMGAYPYQVAILSSRLLGSNILIGRVMPMILDPLNMFEAACEIISFMTPFCF